MRISISLAALSKAQPNRDSAWVIVFDRHTEEVLLLKRSRTSNNPNLWNFPGGGTDGQDPLQAAMRELNEEAGIKTSPSKLKFVTTTVNAGRTSYYFVYVVDRKPHLNLDPKESSKARWMTLKAAREKKLHSRTAALLDRKIQRRLLAMAIRKHG